MRLLIFLSFAFCVIQAHPPTGKFQMAHQWHGLGFSNLPLEAPYNISHSVPFGIARYKNRVSSMKRNLYQVHL